MTKTELEASLNNQRLANILPLIDAVWATGHPTDVQIAAVCLAVMQTPGMDLSCKQALQPWLDMAHPPSGRDLEALRARVSGAVSGTAG